jgi:hypothetical protein
MQKKKEKKKKKGKIVLPIKNSIFLVEHVFRNGCKYTKEVIRQFIRKFPDSQVPHLISVRKLIAKFRDTGSFLDAYRPWRPSISEENTIGIQDRIAMSPNTSLNHLSQQAQIPKSSVHKILKSKLHCRSYKLIESSQLQERDYQSRLNYCNLFQNFMNMALHSFSSLFHWWGLIHLSGYVVRRLWKAPH